MMPRELKTGVYSVGAADPDRRLFDALIPLPDGTTYNAYFIQGSDKNALIDTVDPSTTEVLLEYLDSLNLPVDYIICNHAEQDHSGSIPAILDRFPNARLITNEKCKALLLDHLDLTADRIDVIEDGATLSLGDRTLQFIFLPWVHWPETMATYLVEDQLLFSCDLFGSHLAQDDLFVTDQARNYTSAKRYYAEIMMPFRKSVVKNLAKLAPLPVSMIAPSHGPVYQDPAWILEAYREWTDDAVKDQVLLAYVSMHDSTRLMALHLQKKLIALNIAVETFDLTASDLGELAMAAVDAATIVLATPTVITLSHPSMVSAAYVLNALKPKTRFAALMGSYGWLSKAEEQLNGMLLNIKPQMLPSVFIKGLPKPVDYLAIDALAQSIAAKHQELGIR